MTALSPLVINHSRFPPHQVPFKPTGPMYISSALQYPAAHHPDLTPCFQLSGFSGLAGGMASGQGVVDMEAFQRLSDTYQPEVQGPLIRPRYSIQRLLNEFSNADPTYVAKTAALAASYSQYRPVKGDGQCGWRAVVFGYFESFLSRNLATLAAEKARLQAFDDVLVGVGYDISMLELFVEESVELFDALHRAIASGDRSDKVLLEAFNDESRSNSIVFHFRLMTSATMKMNPDQYQPYLEQPLQEYCHSNIDTFGQEIEQIGLQALTDGVISLAQVNVMVMYLDRSQGGEVTPHPLVPTAAPDWPIITLLYRPGHYDMIYKGDPLRAYRVQVGSNEAQFTSTVAFGSQPSAFHILSQFNEDQSLMSQVGAQGNPYAGPQSSTLPFSRFNPPLVPQSSTAKKHLHESPIILSRPHFDHQYNFTGSSPSSYETVNEVDGTPDYDATYSCYSDTFPMPSHAFHPPMLVPQTHPSSKFAASSSTSSLSVATPVPEKTELKIRISQPCFEMVRKNHEILPLETGPFKNSPFNRSHFANPNFQPEIWKAEDDYTREK